MTGHFKVRGFFPLSRLVFWERDVGEKRPDRDFFHATMMTDFIFATLDKMFSDTWAVYCMICCLLKLHRDSTAAHTNRRLNFASFVSLRDASRTSARESAAPRRHDTRILYVPRNQSFTYQSYASASAEGLRVTQPLASP